MTTENTAGLREALNVVNIEGTIVNIDIKEFKNKETKEESIGGEVDIQVGEDVHTVKVYSKKITKEKKESSLYKGFQTVKNEYQNGDQVRITQGKLGMNDYVGQDGMLRSYPQITTNFINRLTSKDTFDPKARFDLEMVINVIGNEMIKGEETNRLKIKGVVPIFGDKVFPFEVLVSDKTVVKYLDKNYEKGMTITVYGDIINQKIVTKTEKSVGVGKPKIETTETNIREFLVDAASEPLDEDNKKSYSKLAIKKAVEQREEYLAGKTAAPAKGKSPFPKDDKSGKEVDIDDSDLPF